MVYFELIFFIFQYLSIFLLNKDQNGVSLPTKTTLRTTSTSTTTTTTTTKSTTTITPYNTIYLNTTKNGFVFDYCELKPCLNGASCENEFDNFKCACLDKFTGN